MPKLRQTLLRIAATASVLAFALSQVAAATEARPNFVVVITDDQSPMPWAQGGHYRHAKAFGYCGQQDVYTPEIDRLAEDGVIFDRAYVSSSVCSPSRYALLTGRYAGRCSGPSFMKLHPTGTQTRVENNTEIEIDRSNVAKLLGEAGYDTGFVGKCHLIDHDVYYDNNTRRRVGLEVFDRRADPRDPNIAAMMDFNHKWWCKRITSYGFDWAGGMYAANLKELRSEPLNVHNVDWTTDAAVEFIERPRTGPFFLYYATTVPHGPAPWDTRGGKDLYWSGLDGDPGMTGEGYREDLAERFAQQRQQVRDAVTEQGKSMDEAWLTWFDASIGRLRDRLEATGQLENTVFILLSDHGSWRHGKTTLYEGGVRVPMLVHWPAEAKAGHRHEGLVQNVDFTPTILDLAGVDAPADELMDGLSFAGALRGGDGPQRDGLFFELGFARGVTDGRWKYIAIRYDERIERKIAAGSKFAGFVKGDLLDNPYLTRNGHLGHHASRNNPNYFQRDQLYDLSADPREESNVVADYPEVAERMREMLRAKLATFPDRPFAEFTKDQRVAAGG